MRSIVIDIKEIMTPYVRTKVEGLVAAEVVSAHKKVDEVFDEMADELTRTIVAAALGKVVVKE